jgi:hypothetical protein
MDLIYTETDCATGLEIGARSSGTLDADGYFRVLHLKCDEGNSFSSSAVF